MPKVEITETNIWQNGEECNTQPIKEALLMRSENCVDDY